MMNFYISVNVLIFVAVFIRISFIFVMDTKGPC